MSPLLWCLVVNDLLEHLQDEDFLVYDYADDIAILVRGNFLNTLRDLMTNARKIVQVLCETKSLTGKSVAGWCHCLRQNVQTRTNRAFEAWGKGNCVRQVCDIFRGSF